LPVSRSGVAIPWRRDGRNYNGRAGTYTITATVTIPGGYPSQMMTLQNSNDSQLVYIDLSPALVRWLSHGQKAIPQHHNGHAPCSTISRTGGVGRHRA
jgi:hypothetical protein